MKHTLKALLAASVLLSSWGFCAFAIDQINKSFKISVAAELPPQARTVGSASTNMATARNNWLQADMRFKTPDESNPLKRFLDKPQLEVQIATYPGRRPQKNENVIVFSGKINYITLELDGREHHLKALLPAPIFRRYAYDRQIERTVFVVRAVYSVNNKALAIAYGSNKGLPTREIREFFRNIPQNAVKAADTVCGRRGTTWSIIDVNKYEMEQMK